MTDEAEISDPNEPRKSQAMQDFETLIERMANEATPADREKIADLVNPEGTVKIDELTPPQAAVLYSEHQGHNRDFSLAKANYYAGAMGRGDWKLIHQGLAFYRDGKIADGLNLPIYPSWIEFFDPVSIGRFNPFEPEKVGHWTPSKINLSLGLC